MTEEDLLAEQRAFYRLRAPEYDEWWQRQGRYDRGDEDAEAWQSEVDMVAAALEAFGPGGEVIELAGGTGWWTQRLAETAGTLTVVDASAETLAINRQRVGRADIRYVVADLFAWPGREGFDVVFFSFWLSHVPRARFAEFWSLVDRLLKPGGRAFFVDSRRSSMGGDPYVIDLGGDVQRRRLQDGSEHRVVKVYYEPEELAQALKRRGWQATVEGTSRFVYGWAGRVFDDARP